MFYGHSLEDCLIYQARSKNKNWLQRPAGYTKKVGAERAEKTKDMNLKEFQDRALKEVKAYLGHLTEWRDKAARNPELEIPFDIKAWEKAEVGRNYLPKKDGLSRPLPVFCLKIPTGGGKTFLAVKTTDLVHSIYLKRQNGLVVWIVPTLQIYRQTLQRFFSKISLAHR